METVLSAAGRSFLRAFVAAILVLAPGVLSAPNLNRATALGIAAVIASIAAGLKTLQVFVPQISFVPYLAKPFGDWADSFTRAFVAAFLTSIIGILNMPNLSTWHSLVVGAVTGALAAGIRAVQGFLTPGDSPSPTSGIHVSPHTTTAVAPHVTKAV